MILRMRSRRSIPVFLFMSFIATRSLNAASFSDDREFLKKHTELIVLSERSGNSQVAVAPAWQGRVMTSTSGGDLGLSYGWINRDLIASGKFQPHIHVFGGEDRFWLGPEGGQFSIFFAKGAKFELNDWQTPAAIDTLRYEPWKLSKSQVTFRAAFTLTNYSGTQFDLKVNRQVRLLSTSSVRKALGLGRKEALQIVAFETDNRITNAGRNSWTHETGLLSVWILGMFNPSSATTIVVPIKSGAESALGPKLTSDYFGAVPPDRLAVRDSAIFFSGDGKFRSKIGISPRRSRAILGSYDAANRVLTLIQFTQPEGASEYVNSLWKLQDDPYAGDAANSYNDGPATPGAKPLGPFYELESSSPAAVLKPGGSLSHVHRTIHLSGSVESLDKIARAQLGVSLQEIQSALPR